MKKSKLTISPIIFLIVINSAFVCLYLWWYGFFPEFGKTIKEPLDGFSVNDDVYLSDLEEAVPKMTTRALVETYINSARWSNPGPYYNIEDIDLKLSELDPDHDVLLTELLQRNNAGRVLLQAYQDLPTAAKEKKYRGFSNQNAIGHLELLLTAEKIQQHLTSQEISSLPEAADQKQKEKFSDYFYSFAEYNFLYEDTYGENILGDLEWFMEKVEARTKPFEQYRNPVISAILYVNTVSLAADVFR